MKLLQELLSLRTITEEAIETLLASDVWKEHKDDVKTFVPTATYMVKEIPGNVTRYEVYSDESGTRKLVGKMDADKLEASYTPVRANQKEDAEGFTVYREALDVEAFKYDGDTVKLDLEGKTKTIHNGDYLVRTATDDEFSYDVRSTEEFEESFTEEK